MTAAQCGVLLPSPQPPTPDQAPKDGYRSLDERIAIGKARAKELPLEQIGDPPPRDGRPDIVEVWDEGGLPEHRSERQSPRLTCTIGVRPMRSDECLPTAEFASPGDDGKPLTVRIHRRAISPGRHQQKPLRRPLLSAHRRGFRSRGSGRSRTDDSDLQSAAEPRKARGKHGIPERCTHRCTQ